jgi:hypothetical protein
MTPDGWCLHFTGPDARGHLIDLVSFHIEKLLSRDSFAPAGDRDGAEIAHRPAHSPLAAVLVCAGLP